jgi:PAS domain S-box-containing protein
MAEKPLKNLQQATLKVSNHLSPQKKIESLTKAFELFSREAEKLEKAYQELKQQYHAANIALEASNEALKNKLTELDAITYYLNSILSNIAQGILFIDFNGCVTTYNESAEKILGISADQVLFKDFWANFDDEALGFSMKKTLSIKQVSGTTYATIKHPYKGEIILEIETSFIIRKEDSKSATIDAMQGIIVLIRDITEIHLLQMMANRHDRLQELGEMAAMVAHEIRNPLGGIKGFASLLQRDLQDRPELQKMASYIIEGTDNLNHLVSTVLNYARPLKPEIEWTDLVEFMHNLSEHIKVDVTLQPNIKINMTAQEESLLVPMDPGLMQSAILNLTTNAIQAMPKGGILTLYIAKSAENAVLSISDTGIGIPPENIKKLYTPFFTTRPDGNGFGLAEVLKIMQVHNGSIDVKSEVGHGTTFTLKLPLKRKG